ncbi:hypothetical protein FQS96_14135 [Enterococcus faecalis]|uniref:hypothetical protein n=1 Tax=Enterococcus TaxID=1350 RepID=UPI001A95B73A|nr:hypothetical protein [Enterococcus faecalis]MBO1126576.1 hypothetical protein [Enterococcus faecalis]
MRQLTIIWFDQFLDDYRRYTQPEYQKSETEIIEKFKELDVDVEVFVISVSEELTVDGQARMFRFFLVKDDQQEAMQYDGWIDV